VPLRPPVPPPMLPWAMACQKGNRPLLQALPLLFLSLQHVPAEEPHTEVSLFNCSEGLANADLGWSDDKKQWCCRHDGVRCPAASGLLPAAVAENTTKLFNCSSVAGVLSSWSNQHKQWCCNQTGGACTENVAHPMQGDNATVFVNMTAASPGPSKQEPPVERAQAMGATVPSESSVPLFNCTDVRQNLGTVWSEDKKHWCCTHASVGCSPRSVSPTQEAQMNATNKTVLLAAPQPLFNCSEDTHKLDTLWSDDKKQWCCARVSVGCDHPGAALHSVADSAEGANAASVTQVAVAAGPVNATSNSSEPSGGAFDCAEGASNWEAGWSDEKKQWCCKRVSVGCSARPAVSEKKLVTAAAEPSGGADNLYDCPQTSDIVIANWPDDKREWCCRHASVGCPRQSVFTTTTKPQTTTTVVPTTTTAAPSKTTAVPTTTTALLPKASNDVFDCTEGASNFDAGWSEAKKDWCCHHASIGCPKPVPDGDPFDCAEGAKNLDAGWSDAKKQWCCQHASVGCPKQVAPLVGEPSAAVMATTTTEEPFNCKEEVHNLDTSWSEMKKQWCCKREHIGCATTTAPLPADTLLPEFDCTEEKHMWREAWSTLKKRWCCHHARIGCEEADPALEAVPEAFGTGGFDCSDTPKNLEKPWPEPKQLYCCEKRGFGCPKDCDKFDGTYKDSQGGITVIEQDGCRGAMTSTKHWRGRLRVVMLGKMISILAPTYTFRGHYVSDMELAFDNDVVYTKFDCSDFDGKSVEHRPDHEQAEFCCEHSSIACDQKSSLRGDTVEYAHSRADPHARAGAKFRNGGGEGEEEKEEEHPSRTAVELRTAVPTRASASSSPSFFFIVISCVAVPLLYIHYCRGRSCSSSYARRYSGGGTATRYGRVYDQLPLG